MSGSQPARWSQERDAALRDLWERGVPCAAIAEALRISRNSVLGRAHRMHLPVRPSPIPGGVTRPRKAKAAAPAPAPVKLKFWLPAPVKPAGACQWPSGVRGAIRYCEAPTVPGHSYCEAHFRRAYTTIHHKNQGASHGQS